jgi:biofilm PGA synthesis protein PgaA
MSNAMPGIPFSTAFNPDHNGPLGAAPILRIALLFTVAITLSIGTLPASASDAPRVEREAAVAEARAGNARGGLKALQSLLQEHPDDSRLLADTVVVAGWAGDDAYVLEVYGRPQTPKDDATVAEAAAHAARNLHEYTRSLSLYRRAESLAPEDWQARLGEAMVLVDQGDYSSASSLMRPLFRDHGREKDIELGQAYLCERQANFACALSIYEARLEKAPTNQEIQCQFARSLSSAGGETYALHFCDRPASDATRVLDTNAAAENLRWTVVSGSSWAQRKDEASRALALLDRVIAASSVKDRTAQRAQFDRILALSELGRWRDVTQSYERLTRLGIAAPPYALEAVAGAYLQLRQPRQAEHIYRALVQHSPADGGAWSGLAYAQLENENISASFHSIDQAYAYSPVWIGANNLKVPQTNSLHTDLALQAAQMRGYAGLLKEEQRRLTALSGLAPANIALRRALAMNYLHRGWKLRAIEEESIADSYEERDELPSLEQVEILNGAGDRDDADKLLAPLLRREGSNLAVDRFLRERTIERGWQLDAAGAYEWSSGHFIGSTDQHSEAHLYTPLADNRWRVYAHELSDSGNFAAGFASRTRAGLGMTYNYNRQMAWGEIAGDSGTNEPVVAGNGGVQFSLGDHWTLRAQGDSDSISDVQLIAVLARIRARSADFNLGWRANELLSANVGLQRVLFSDGNQRAAISAAVDRRLWTTPHLELNLSAEEWASTNSRDQNRVYFNPRHDFSLGPRGTLNWLTWRHYDRSFHQEVSLYSAPYWQENYGIGSAISASYGVHWTVSKRLGFLCKAVWDSQPYDGSNEPYTAVNFGLTWGSQ